MIGLKEAIRIHNILIDKFGGVKGIRDKGALESALRRPYSTFDKHDLYPTPIDKVAALIESIVTNHPFVDGNKRVGYALMRLTLLKVGLDIETGQDDKYEFVMSISKGEMNFEKIKDWLEVRIKKYRVGKGESHP